MTALSEYERLECTAVWRPEPDAQRRDVFVSIGDATLMIHDSADRMLAHWSLAAVSRVNPGERPALYTPGADAPEELEIEDEVMIDAINRVQRSIQRRRPRPGRLRLALLAGGLAAVLAGAVFWLPDALIRHAASVVPQAKRAELGARLLTDIRRVAGTPCTSVNGRNALERLKARLFPSSPGALVILSSGIPASRHLPGGLILLNRTLVEDHEDAAVVAGYVLAELERAAAIDPVEDLLRTGGFPAAFRLLTTGDVEDAVLEQHAERLLAEPAAPVPDDRLLARFAEAGVASTPYAYARDISGETTLALIEADPGPGAQPLLSDGQWVSLQGICGE